MRDVLTAYKTDIDQKLQQQIALLGDDNTLKSACEYAIMNGGKRFRPAIVMMVADALNTSYDVSLAAIGIEFLHAASLIADDLPCMDNDDMRRNKPSLHKVYGEAVALLASYSLIAAGYRAIYENFSHLQQQHGITDTQILTFALDNITHNTGIMGATGGQFYDIFPPENSLDMMKKVIRMKTVTLFETAFVLGWLFGGGDTNALTTVKKVAEHFGMAFQIQDDLDDIDQDLLNKREANLAIHLGEQTATQLFYQELDALQHTLTTLNINSPHFQQIILGLRGAPSS